MIETGCYEDMTNEQYHDDKDSLSRSAILDFVKSPHIYFAKHLSEYRPVQEKSRALLFGDAFHAMMIEPLRFEDEFCVKLDKAPLLKDVGRDEYERYKELQATFEEKNAGKHILTQDEYLDLTHMRNAILASSEAVALITKAIECETSYFWQDEHSGLMCKARPDLLHESIIVDLKTTNDASPRAFQRSVVDYGYHVQAAMTRAGVKAVKGRDIPTFICIAVEKNFPYSVGIYVLDEVAMEQGEYIYKQALLDIKAAKECGDYPGYGVQTISIPGWAMK